jgi:hypothetical protein
MCPNGAMSCNSEGPESESDAQQQPGDVGREQDVDNDEGEMDVPAPQHVSLLAIFGKLALASVALYFASAVWPVPGTISMNDGQSDAMHRRLSEQSSIPSYMKPLFEDLQARKTLFETTPPNEIKYWFEYTGPLQVCNFYMRWSCSKDVMNVFTLHSSLLNWGSNQVILLCCFHC